MQKKGIIICCYGARGYGFAAYNLAFSIKHYCKDYPIALFTEQQTISQLDEDSKSVFDIIKIFDKNDYTMDGIPDPATMKIRVLSNTPFNETLYLDADTVCIGDISGLMESLSSSKGYFYTDIQGKGKKGEKIHYDAWSNHEYTFPFFGLDDDTTFYSTNSSWLYFKNGAELTELKGWMIHYLQKRYPIMKLKTSWINGRLPDELLWSGVLSKIGYDASGFKPMYYGNTYDSIVDVRSKYQFITYYGRIGSGVNLVNPQWLEFMDRHIKSLHELQGLKYMYKMSFCYTDKALNKK